MRLTMIAESKNVNYIANSEIKLVKKCPICPLFSCQNIHNYLIYNQLANVHPVEVDTEVILKITYLF